MKNFYLFGMFFFFSVVAFSQNNKAEQADSLASEKEYTAEIVLRKEIMASLKDTISDAYKEQAYKTKLAKSFLTIDRKEWLALVEKAVRIFETMENQSPDGKIKLDIEYSNILIGNRQLEKALKVGNDIRTFILEQEKATGTSHKKELAEILAILANTKWFMRDYDGAIALYKKALEINKELYGYYSLETAFIHSYLAMVNTFTFNLNATLDHAKKAAIIYEKVQPENKYLLYRQYFNNFIYIKDYGDIEKLGQVLKKIENYYRENKNDSTFTNTKDRSFPNFNAVRVLYLFTQLDYASATADTLKTEHFYKLLQKKIPKEPASYTRQEKSSIMNSIMETGRLFNEYDNYVKAKKYYLNALKFSEKNHFGYGQIQVFLRLSSLGVDSKNWDEAINYSKKAFQHPNYEKFPYPANFHHNLGKAYFAKNEYEKAVEELNKVLEIYLNGNAKANYYGIQNLNGTGQVFMKMYQVQPEKKYIEKAYSAYQKSSQLLSEVYRGDKYNDRLSSLQDGVNNGLLSCALILDQYQGEVVRLIEMNNSDYLWSNFLKKQKNFPIDPLHLEKNLDSLIALKNNFESQLKIPELTTVEKDSLKAKTKEIETKIASLRHEIKESPLPYYRFSKNNFQLEHLQAGMEEGEMAIKYILADSLVFAYGITKNTLQLEKLPTTSDSLHQKMNAYLASIKNIRGDYREKAEGLYTVLITPMKPQKHSKITIVPDGFLGYLPFETLIGTNGDFFVQNHPVSYASSLKLWDIQKNIQENPSNELGVFSPEYNLQLAAAMPDTDIQTLVRSGNYELAGARKEAQKINALFGGKLFISDSATKTNFIENAEKYDMLHLAMHAVLDENEPDKSSFIFSNNEKLYLSELYNLNLPTKLVVLSACNTGTGKIKNGEGVQSLSRAFTYAGVKSTVRSLWPVPDRETAQIMTSFYQNLKKGEKKAIALRQAKLDYLEETDEKTLQHPYYWAGFVVSGDVSPVFSPVSKWWYALGGGAVVGAIFLYARKRKNRSKTA